MSLPSSFSMSEEPATLKGLLQQESLWIWAALWSPWLWGWLVLAMGIIHGHFGLWPHPTVMGGAALGLAFVLGVAAVVDFRLMILPYLLNFLIILAGVLVPPLVLGAGWLNTLAGLVLAAGGLGFCAWLTTHLTGKPSLGGGDLLLVAGLGAWVGASGLPPMMLIVSFLGILLVLVRLAGQSRAEVFPFGPLLALAGWLAFVGQGLYWQGVMSLYG